MLTKIPPDEITAEQRAQWGQAMAFLSMQAPGFQYLFYQLLAHKQGKEMTFALFTPDCPVAMTDGKHIMINPATFFDETQYNTKNRVFIIAHEIVHNMFNDCAATYRAHRSGVLTMTDGTTRPFVNMLWQMSMDYRINALLVDSRIGEVPKNACYKPDRFGAHMSALDIYRELYDELAQKCKKRGKGGNGDGDQPGEDDVQGQGHGNQFDEVVAPGTSTGESATEAMPNQEQWAVEVARAKHMQEVKHCGKMPGAMQRMFDEILEPEVPWTDLLRTEVARRSNGEGFNWKRPNKRFIGRDLFLPSRSGQGAGWIVVWGDTSGSISEAELNRYMAELYGIIEQVSPRRLTILWCDAEIQHVDELEDTADLLNVKARGVGGGGGTSVQPCFEWIDEQLAPPDMFIGFTDGHFDWPSHAPSYPVIWALTTDYKEEWGTPVRIHPKRKEYK